MASVLTSLFQVAEFSLEERHEVVKNLYLLPQIDYQAEEVLAEIAKRAPRDVVEFLCARLYGPVDHDIELADNVGEKYEALPYQLYKLQDPLSTDPEMVVQKVLDCYRKDSASFEFRGARLLQVVFPQFSEAFKRALVELVRGGGDAELQFVAGVLRAYNGETFIHPVAKELIKRLPPGSPLVMEVEIALQSTDVVSGEYGMAEAYEKKRLEALVWLQDPDDHVRTFAGKYISQLEVMRDSERAQAEESITLRKFTYGEK